MKPGSSHTDWFRAQLVVLSDRRPPPDAPRTALEAAIEWALREHDGVWLVRHADPEADAGAAGALERERWSVLEGAPGQPRSSTDEWAGYVRSNAAYAERIIESVRPDGAVWLNGHGWLLVAPALREHGHRGPIGVVLDVPFPARAQLEALPWHAELMAALCQPDLLGFRTPACAESFEVCRARTGLPRPWLWVLPDGAEPTARTDPAEWGGRFLQLLGLAARRDLRRTSIA